jgi:hypothetical protein
MANVVLSDGIWINAEIVTLPEVPLIAQEVVQELLQATVYLHRTVPVAKIELDATEFPATYLATLKDGRAWEQMILSRVPDPGMTFTVEDWWTRTEVSLHRAVRDACVTLLTSHLVTKIELVPR